MRRLLITIAVVGLILAVLTSDSAAIRPPARDVAIPIWLGDPDSPAFADGPSNNFQPILASELRDKRSNLYEVHGCLSPSPCDRCGRKPQSTSRGQFKIILTPFSFQP